MTTTIDGSCGDVLQAGTQHLSFNILKGCCQKDAIKVPKATKNRQLIFKNY